MGPDHRRVRGRGQSGPGSYERRAMVDTAEQLAECISRDEPAVRGPNAPEAIQRSREELSCRSFTARALGRLGVTLEPRRNGEAKPWRDRAARTTTGHIQSSKVTAGRGGSPDAREE